MARHTRLTNLAVNTQASALAQLLDGGYIEVYDGDQPDFAEASVTSQKLLVTMKFGSPAFRPPVAGVIIANPISPGVAVATGRPSWSRISSGDRTPVMDVSAGTSNCTMILPVAILEAGITLTVDFNHTIVKG